MFPTKEWIKENKHLLLWSVIIVAFYLLYLRNQNSQVPEGFIKALQITGGLAFGLNTLITLIN